MAVCVICVCPQSGTPVKLMDVDTLKSTLFSLLSLQQQGSPEAANAFLEGWPDEDGFVSELASHLSGDGNGNDEYLCATRDLTITPAIFVTPRLP